MSTVARPDPPGSDRDERWRRALEEPFASVRTAAGDLGGEGWAPADTTGAQVFEQLIAAPAAQVLLDAVRREIPVAVRVGGELPAGPAAVAPDGLHVAVLADAERVEVWDREHARMVWSRDLPGLRHGRWVAVRGARFVVVGSARGSAVDLVAVEPNDTAPVGALQGRLVGLGVWEPDRLVSVSDDATVTVWSLAGGPARRMAAPSAAPVEDAVVEPDRERVVLTHRGGMRHVLDLVTGEVTEAAPGAVGVALAGRALRVAADPGGRLRVTAAGGEVGSVACAVREGTRLVTARREALVIVSDVDARVPTTVWTARGATLHEALGHPLLDATPEQLAVVDVIEVADLSDTARRCLALFREVLALRLRDAVEITVESAVGAGTRLSAGPTDTAGTAVDGPCPRDVEIDEPASEAESGSEVPGPRVPAYLSSFRTTWGSG